jgi:hypothetical protein
MPVSRTNTSTSWECHRNVEDNVGHNVGRNVGHNEERNVGTMKRTM